MQREQCGTKPGYNLHTKADEKPCEPCRRANSEWMRLYRAKTKKTYPMCPCGSKIVAEGAYRCSRCRHRKKVGKTTLGRILELVEEGRSVSYIAGYAGAAESTVAAALDPAAPAEKLCACGTRILKKEHDNCSYCRARSKRKPVYKPAGKPPVMTGAEIQWVKDRMGVMRAVSVFDPERDNWPKRVGGVA